MMHVTLHCLIGITLVTLTGCATTSLQTDYRNQGRAQYQRGTYSEAVVSYTKAIEIKPDDPQLLLGRGNAYAALKQSTEAIADYGRAIAIDPGLAGAFIGRAAVFAAKMEFAKAIADYSSALALDSAPQLYYQRARLYIIREEENLALADLNNVLELQPDFEGALYNRGLIFAAKGDNDRAVEDFRKALSRNPDYVDAIVALADAYLKLGQKDQARTYYQRACELGHQGMCEELKQLH
jgi:tetratricopeptide (TPR) repeat protein